MAEKGSSGGRERRETERVAINDAFAGIPSTTYISDLSEGGVFVHTRRRAPQVSLFDLHQSLTFATG